jgi:hypothetical protein
MELPGLVGWIVARDVLPALQAEVQLAAPTGHALVLARCYSCPADADSCTSGRGLVNALWMGDSFLGFGSGGACNGRRGIYVG